MVGTLPNCGTGEKKGGEGEKKGVRPLACSPFLGPVIMGVTYSFIQ